MQIPREDKIRYASIWFLAFGVYANTFFHGFVFDDVAAVKNNPDILPETPIWEIFKHDFWGQPMDADHSHKSYRPLSVLTFRWNFALSGRNATAYHVTNVLLHATVSLLVAKTVEIAFQSSKHVAFCTGLLFAVHPVHTEAVAGVVGRAELLSTMFYLLAIMVYCTTVAASFGKLMTRIFLVTLLIAIGTFCKEQCITAFAMCFLHDLLNLQASKSERRGKVTSCILRWSVLVIGGIVVLLLRIKVVQGSELPVFSSFDNPAASAESPTRQLTYHYLLVINTWLLACPWQLLCDWSMGTVPLVTEWSDLRNLLSLLFWLVTVYTASKLMTNKNRPAILACASAVLPFLPCCNLFFPVGFVIAERVLYNPSVGFCMLVALGYNKLGNQRCFKMAFASLLIVFCVRTMLRNAEWRDETALFTSALKMTNSNAKIWNNVGHTFEATGQLHNALVCFQQAREVQPDDGGSWYNIARTLVALKQHQLAEETYRTALTLLPQAKEVTYTTRVRKLDLQLLCGLSRVLITQKRFDEAEQLLQRAMSMRADFGPTLCAMGELHFRTNRRNEALLFYKQALRLEPRNADILFNVGVLEYSLTGNATLALGYLDDALKEKSSHQDALYYSALVIQDSVSIQRFETARFRLGILLQDNPQNSDALFQLAMLASHEGRFEEAEKIYSQILCFAPDYVNALFNLALLYTQQVFKPLHAVQLAESLLTLQPAHVSGHILLGQLHVNQFRNFDQAQQNFEAVLSLDPDNLTAKHSLCVVAVERGQLEEGVRCLEQVKQLAPALPSIDIHLQVARSRLAGLQSSQNNVASSTP